MKKQTHSLQIRIMSMFLALVCILGLLPGAALAASPDTIKLEDCTYNGVHYVAFVEENRGDDFCAG